jgi:hypothetical protein
MLYSFGIDLINLDITFSIGLITSTNPMPSGRVMPKNNLSIGGSSEKLAVREMSKP